MDTAVLIFSESIDLDRIWHSQYLTARWLPYSLPVFYGSGFLAVRRGEDRRLRLDAGRR
jgi:hypothetical protein